MPRESSRTAVLPAGVVQEDRTVHTIRRRYACGMSSYRMVAPPAMERSVLGCDYPVQHNTQSTSPGHWGEI